MVAPARLENDERPPLYAVLYDRKSMPRPVAHLVVNPGYRWMAALFCMQPSLTCLCFGCSVRRRCHLRVVRDTGIGTPISKTAVICMWYQSLLLAPPASCRCGGRRRIWAIMEPKTCVHIRTSRHDLPCLLPRETHPKHSPLQCPDPQRRWRSRGRLVSGEGTRGV